MPDAWATAHLEVRCTCGRPVPVTVLAQVSHDVVGAQVLPVDDPVCGVRRDPARAKPNAGSRCVFTHAHAGPHSWERT